MILDKKAEFADAQSIVGVAATAINSTNYIDLGVARDIGPGEDLWLVVLINQTVLAAGGASNVTFQLLEDSQADMASGSARTLWSSGAIPKATLVAGYVVAKIKIPATSKQYLRVTATPDTNATTQGKMDAFLTPNADAWQSYASGYSIL